MDSIQTWLSSLLGTSPMSNGLGASVLAIFVAYLGGVLSSLTPCIYPMIPITVSVVGGVQPGRKHPTWHAVLVRGGSYVAGMAVVYSLLGVAAGVTGKIFGTFTNTSGWYLGLGAIMTLAALAMMDVIPFDPQAILNRWRSPHGKPSFHAPTETGSLWSAFFLGASSGFIAAPCTTPVLTAILAYITKTQSVFYGMTLMLAFSLGLGTLLMVIAAFAGSLQVLPRSGHWMKHIKVGSGVVLLLFAEYLIFSAGQRMGGSP